jgi:hypothetical protein
MTFKEIIDDLAKESGLPPDVVEAVEETRKQV